MPKTSGRSCVLRYCPATSNMPCHEAQASGRRAAPPWSSLSWCERELCQSDAHASRSCEVQRRSSLSWCDGTLPVSIRHAALMRLRKLAGYTLAGTQPGTVLVCAIACRLPKSCKLRRLCRRRCRSQPRIVTTCSLKEFSASHTNESAPHHASSATAADFLTRQGGEARRPQPPCHDVGFTQRM